MSRRQKWEWFMWLIVTVGSATLADISGVGQLWALTLVGCLMMAATLLSVR